MTISGTGFRDPRVTLSTPNGLVGPLVPLAGGTATQIRVRMPATLATGTGIVQVINAPYTGNVTSNAVAVVLGARPS